MIDDAPTLPAGTRVAGRYEVEALLGRGGMAEVYRVRDTSDRGTLRALKLLDPGAAVHPGFRSRFLTEAKTMAELPSPYIARVFDWGSHGDTLFIVMEYVAGGTGLDRIRRGRTDLLSTLRVGFELLLALGAAHRAGVIHRDVKPSNLLLSSEGLRLADFGIARITEKAVPHATVTGDNLGTLGYAAPEQTKNAKAAGPRADLFSAGATIFAMVTRRSPTGLAQSATIPAVLDGVPAELKPVIARACAPEPEARYQSARDMAAALAAVRDRLGAEVGRPPEAESWMREFDHLVGPPDVFLASPSREAATEEVQRTTARAGLALPAVFAAAALLVFSLLALVGAVVFVATR